MFNFKSFSKKLKKLFCVYFLGLFSVAIKKINSLQQTYRPMPMSAIPRNIFFIYVFRVCISFVKQGLIFCLSYFNLCY